MSLASRESVRSANNVKSSRYRTVSRYSGADETLFGSPKRGGGKSAPSSGHQDKTRKEEVSVITKDLIRKIKVPAKDPSELSIVLNTNQYVRIKEASKVLTQAEKQAKLEAIKAQKEAAQSSSQDRKNFMSEMEAQRIKREKPSDLEKERKDKGKVLLAKAEEQLNEQEDEIKKLNEIILNAKCHAIRDAQLKEKHEIHHELTAENKRLDEMMEIERLRALQQYEQREMERQYKQIEGSNIIKKQINDNEQRRILEDEKREQEKLAMLRYLEKLQNEDISQLEKKKESQRKIMSDVAKANDEIQRQKEERARQEKFAELKVMEYLQEKEAREIAYQNELEKQKVEKEKEIAHMRALQERAKDQQAEKDALRAKRIQEEVERDQRKKDREQALKKAETESQLRRAREQQVQMQEHFLAIEAQRERQEFERVLAVQQEGQKHEESKDRSARSRRLNHAEEVRKQIKEKEGDLIHARNMFFEEGIKLDQEAQERRRRLDEIKRKKLEELQGAGVPTKYVNEVARRAMKPQTSLITH